VPFVTQIPMALKSLWRFFLYFFRCRHHHLTSGEGRYICPNCGDSVVLQWVVLRCRGCGHKRQGINAWGQLHACDGFCSHCGHHQYQSQALKNPAYYQLNGAVLTITNEQSYWTKWHRLVSEKITTVQVWLEPNPVGCTVAIASH